MQKQYDPFVEPYTGSTQELWLMYGVCLCNMIVHVVVVVGVGLEGG